MKIGLYAGSFNPVHKGHQGIIDNLLEQKYVDKVVVIPLDSYWDKISEITITEKCKMLDFLFSPKILIDGSCSQDAAYQILRKYEERYPEAKLYYIIGTDNLNSLHLWKNLDEVLKYQFIIYNRDNAPYQKIINSFGPELKYEIADNFGYFPYSSTEIREKIKNNEDVSESLDEKVIAYIKERGLYEK